MADGAEVLYRLERALKQADELEVRKALNKGLKGAARVLDPLANQAVVDVSPKRGGMAEREQAVKFTPRVLTGSKTAGIKVATAGKWVAAKTINRSGTFRHPVHADPSKTRREWTWVTQAVPGGQGFLARALDPHAPAVRAEIDTAIRELLTKIARASLG